MQFLSGVARSLSCFRIEDQKARRDIMTANHIAMSVDALDHVIERARRLNEVQIGSVDKEPSPEIQAENLADHHAEVRNSVQSGGAVGLAARSPEAVKCSVLPGEAIVVGLAHDFQSVVYAIGERLMGAGKIETFENSFVQEKSVIHVDGRR